MPAYKLIVDRKHAAAFHDLASPRPLEGLALDCYQFEAALPPPRQLISAINEQRATCLCVPVQKWKAVFFDMDSTVIAEESIVELSMAAGSKVAEEVAAITERAMAGELDFATALRHRVRLLRGLPVKVVSDVATRLTINPGMHSFASKARAQGVRMYLVSGGFLPLAQVIVDKLDFDGFTASDLESKDGILTGQLRGPLIDAQAKADFLSHTCQQLQISFHEVLAVGDGANDLPMLQRAGTGLGYFPKQVLLPHINGAIYDDYRVLIHASF